MEEKNFENTPQEAVAAEEPASKPYVPRPAYQVWAARIGVVIVIIAVLLYYYHIAWGGL